VDVKVGVTFEKRDALGGGKRSGQERELEGRGKEVCHARKGSRNEGQKRRSRERGKRKKKTTANVSFGDEPKNDRRGGKVTAWVFEWRAPAEIGNAHQKKKEQKKATRDFTLGEISVGLRV